MHKVIQRPARPDPFKAVTLPAAAALAGVAAQLGVRAAGGVVSVRGRVLL